MRAIFDTGSSNTWILNKNTNIDVPKKFSYDDKASSTSKKTEKYTDIMFGAGSLEGHLYTDDLRIGSQIHINNYKFGNIEKTKYIFDGENFEAIVGMAYPEFAI